MCIKKTILFLCIFNVIKLNCGAFSLQNEFFTGVSWVLPIAYKTKRIRYKFIPFFDYLKFIRILYSVNLGDTEVDVL